MHPKDLQIKNFSYSLPDERIAKHPLAYRDQSKLLIYKDKEIHESVYQQIANEIPQKSLLLFNNTKVVEARILFQKPSGAIIEIFCLEPDDQYPDISSAMLQKGRVFWKCLVGGAKKWKEIQIVKTIEFGEKHIVLTAERKEQINDYYLIEFNWDDCNLSFAEILHAAGLIPLPPYLNRDVETIDLDRYQTIYAKFDGSVAAPTAGLHFTESVFELLDNKNIERAYLTLHVGAGTFKPVKAEKIEGHEMHAEFIEVSEALIQQIITNLDNHIIPVGTTSMRTIESLYWLGLKTIMNSNIQLIELIVNQWDPYEIEAAGISASMALNALIVWMQKNEIDLLITKTQIIIAPGYQFKIVKALITNFHQPQSTLLLLVSALIGEEWKRVYQYALENDFRFLSYGDGCLLIPS